MTLMNRKRIFMRKKVIHWNKTNAVLKLTMSKLRNEFEATNCELKADSHLEMNLRQQTVTNFVCFETLFFSK